MLQVEEKNGSLLIPPFGAGLKLLYKNKHNEEEEEAQISPGPKKNHYYAYFQQDDVDFEIEMENSSCKDRSICFDIEIMEEEHGFVVKPEKTWKIETLESNGKKLHFIRQSGEEGKSLVSSTASTRRISRRNASKILSQIKFQINYEIKNFSITVKYEEGENKSLDVTSKTTIAELTNKIAREIRHPVDNFSVSLNGKEFDDYDPETTVHELKINEDSQLICEKIKFPVQVKMKGRKRSTVFKIPSWERVQDLKKKIEEKEGISVAQQKLFYNEKELYFNMSALGWAGITRNSILELEVIENFPLKIKIIPSNKIMTIPVCSRNTISDVRKKIEEQAIFSTQQLTLYLHGSPLSWNDYKKLLEDVGIENEDGPTIFLVIEKHDEKPAKISKMSKKTPHECETGTCFPITVKKRIDRSTIHLNVCSSELVRDVKEKLCEITGFAVEDQKLRCRRSKASLLKLQNELPLELYGIEKNTRLVLFASPKGDNIIVTDAFGDEEDSDSVAVKIPFSPSLTVTAIKCRIQEEEGIPYTSTRISFDGEDLWDGRTLADCNIQKGDVLHFHVEQFGGGCNCQKPSCRVCAYFSAQDLSERGAITFGEKSNQTFSSCSFDADESIEIEPFIIELRLAGVPLIP